MSNPNTERESPSEGYQAGNDLVKLRKEAEDAQKEILASGKINEAMRRARGDIEVDRIEPNRYSVTSFGIASEFVSDARGATFTTGGQSIRVEFDVEKGGYKQILKTANYTHFLLYNASQRFPSDARSQVFFEKNGKIFMRGISSTAFRGGVGKTNLGTGTSIAGTIAYLNGRIRNLDSEYAQKIEELDIEGHIATVEGLMQETYAEPRLDEEMSKYVSAAKKKLGEKGKTACGIYVSDHLTKVRILNEQLATDYKKNKELYRSMMDYATDHNDLRLKAIRTRIASDSQMFSAYASEKNFSSEELKHKIRDLFDDPESLKKEKKR